MKTLPPPTRLSSDDALKAFGAVSVVGPGESSLMRRNHVTPSLGADLTEQFVGEADASLRARVTSARAEGHRSCCDSSGWPVLDVRPAELVSNTNAAAREAGTATGR